MNKKLISPDGEIVELAQPQNQMVAGSPMAMMIEAKQAGFGMEDIEKMMDLQDRNDKRLAKMAFDKAMAEFKKDPPQIIKDMYNDQYKSKYTSLGNMVNSVNEAMGPFGLNTHWEFPSPQVQGGIAVACILAHELGHEIRVTLEGPSDDGGKKNPLQGRKSARTYLKLETFEAVTGMASENANVDDDGNGADEPDPPEVEYINEDQVNSLHAKITESLNMEIFLRWLATSAIKAGRLEDIPANMFKTVMSKVDASIKAKGEASATS
jgi:hypothetical protein